MWEDVEGFGGWMLLGGSGGVVCPAGGPASAPGIPRVLASLARPAIPRIFRSAALAPPYASEGGDGWTFRPLKRPAFAGMTVWREGQAPFVRTKGARTQ